MGNRRQRDACVRARAICAGAPPERARGRARAGPRPARVTGMNAASHQEIAAVLGEVDDLIVQRIADTGASLDEIGEALDQLEDELQFGEEDRLPTSPRVAQVRAILEELVDDIAGADYERTFPTA